MYDFSKFNFVPKTKTEKLLSSVIKFQKKINKWLSYAIGKLFKKIKKLQPANYVSFEDEFLAHSGESSNEEKEDKDEDDEEGKASSSSRAINPLILHAAHFKCLFNRNAKFQCNGLDGSMSLLRHSMVPFFYTILVFFFFGLFLCFFASFSNLFSQQNDVK